MSAGRVSMSVSESQGTVKCLISRLGQLNQRKRDPFLASRREREPSLVETASRRYKIQHFKFIRLVQFQGRSVTVVNCCGCE